VKLEDTFALRLLSMAMSTVSHVSVDHGVDTEVERAIRVAGDRLIPLHADDVREWTSRSRDSTLIVKFRAASDGLLPDVEHFDQHHGALERHSRTILAVVARVTTTRPGATTGRCWSKRTPGGASSRVSM
jgi:hypothetical protein